jgi:hypothetical protein|nr:MAG TPA: hypothetical protein [Caudoviricetes sp.]
MNKIIKPEQVFIGENRYYHMESQRDYIDYYVSVTDESMNDVAYEELIALRNLINEIEKRHNEELKKGGEL